MPATLPSDIKLRPVELGVGEASMAFVVSRKQPKLFRFRSKTLATNDRC